MSTVEMRLDSEHAMLGKTEVLAALDKEVERFSTFMANLPDWRAKGPLIGSEKAILKTYLVHKLRGVI